MTHAHTFWFLAVWACVLWYCVITVYVAVRGASDIRQMLRDLRERGDGDPAAPDDGANPR